MGFFDFLFGSEDKQQQLPTKTPQQQRLLGNQIRQANQLGQGGYQDAMSILQQYLNPQSDIYRNFEQPYLNEFNQKTLPGIANQYAGQNAMGSGLMTSGFGQSLGTAGANLQTQLAQMKQQFQRQSINDLLNQYNQLTNQGLNSSTFENTYQPGSQGLLGGALQGLGQGFGSALGNPLGAGLSNFFGGGQQSNPFGIGGG